jgi:hypothetical protein
MNARVAVDTLRATQLAANVDELGALESEIAPYKQKALRVEALRKAIRAHFDTHAALLSFEAPGTLYTALLGPRASETWINPALLIKAIGAKAYSAIATVTLKVLERSVTADIAAGVTSKKASGSRTLITVENVPRA